MDFGSWVMILFIGVGAGGKPPPTQVITIEGMKTHKICIEAAHIVWRVQKYKNEITYYCISKNGESPKK